MCDGDDTHHPDPWPGSFHITEGAHAEIWGLLRGVSGQGHRYVVMRLMLNPKI